MVGGGRACHYEHAMVPKVMRGWGGVYAATNLARCEGWCWGGPGWNLLCLLSLVVATGEVVWPRLACSERLVHGLNVACCILVSVQPSRGGGGGNHGNTVVPTRQNALNPPCR